MARKRRVITQRPTNTNSGTRPARNTVTKAPPNKSVVPPKKAASPNVNKKVMIGDATQRASTISTGVGATTRRKKRTMKKPSSQRRPRELTY